MVRIENQIFKGKQNIPWRAVENYVKQFVGMEVENEEYEDRIKIPSNFPSEYVGSKYSKQLKGGLAKVKANAAQVVADLIVTATNRRFVENKGEKHKNDAIYGWYRYDVFFSFAVMNEKEQEPRWNKYRATLVVRINDAGLFLHDMINIKKEASTPFESE